MVNIARIMQRLDALSQFNATPGQGVTRLSFTHEDKQAREWFIQEAEALGLKVRVDGVGNIFARLGGQGAAILCGSHLDTVPHGGKLDGALGVIAALEIANVLQEEQVSLRHPFEVVVWADEEGGRFGTGLLGSRAAIGALPSEELQTAKDAKGVLLGEALLEVASGDISNALLDPQAYKGYLEVHIEQGSHLVDGGYQVGIVEGIVGISRLVVKLNGQANHAGTTPMNRRRDALYTAAKIVLGIRELGVAHMPGVATVGFLQVAPGAVNVIPGEVDLTIEVRHLDIEVLEQMVEKARLLVEMFCQADGIEFEATRIKSSMPSLTNPELKAVLLEEAQKLQLRHLSLPSGAGHDAQSVAQIMPVGMLFVPSIGGISHSPLEDSHPADIEAAANVLLNAAKRLLLV